MNSEYEILKKSFESIKNKIPYIPDVAIVLGSGLGIFLENKKIDLEIKYNEIENMPISTVEGHTGSFVFLTIDSKKIVCMNGRVHFYEGYDIKEVVRPIRLLKMMGVKKIILTNAAGGVNKKFKQGDLMIITDHISQFITSPLIGKNIDELGVRFPDMTEVYNKNLINIVKSVSKKNKIKLKKGVYVQFTGPNYETPTEIKFAKKIGADAVGMSTVVEALTAKHMDMDVIGISLITNMAAGISKNKLSHEEVKLIAKNSSEKFVELIVGVIKNI